MDGWGSARKTHRSQPQHSNTLKLLNALIIVFAFPSMLLTMRALYKSTFAYRYARKVVD